MAVETDCSHYICYETLLTKYGCIVYQDCSLPCDVPAGNCTKSYIEGLSECLDIECYAKPVPIGPPNSTGYSSGEICGFVLGTICILLVFIAAGFIAFRKIRQRSADIEENTENMDASQDDNAIIPRFQSHRVPFLDSSDDSDDMILPNQSSIVNGNFSLKTPSGSSEEIMLS